MPDPLTDAQRAELQRTLEALAAELGSQLERSRDGARPVDLDEPIGRVSRVDAMQQQQMIAANRSAAGRRRRQVEAALERCRDGTLGECAACGDEIGWARLSARPESALCLACQQRREAAR